MMKFAVLMSVYHRESPSFLSQSLDSLVAQTWPADEVVIVKDGPLGEELERVIDRYKYSLPISTVELKSNQGLGPALRVGVEQCRFGLIARMDSDDISEPRRFERQIKFLDSHPEIDIVGSSIAEFDSDPSCCISVRHLPEEDSAIRSFAKIRNPLNHMTVVFRREAVLAAGNYRSAAGFEDYDLWVRMLQRNSRFHNLVDPLVLARCGNGMQGRRGGIGYAGREIALFWSFRKRGFLTTLEFLRNVIIRAPLRILPASFRSRVYNDLLRKSAPPSEGTGLDC